MKSIISIFLVLATIEYLKRPTQKEEKEFTLQDELNSMNEVELQNALTKVVNEERYELACVIRDFINKKYG
jgi:DNA phosphorothioation-dependent restriction protein DptG